MHQFHTTPPRRLASTAFSGVDVLPTREVDAMGAAVGHQIRDVVCRGRCLRQDALDKVGDHRFGSLLPAQPVAPDTACRATLDPSGHVQAADDLAVDTRLHPALDVGYHAAHLVERDVVDGHSAITDRAQHESGLEVDAVVGRNDRDVLACLGVDIAHGVQFFDLPVAGQLRRRRQEAEDDALVALGGGALRELLREPQFGRDRRIQFVVGVRGLRHRVECELVRIDDHVDAVDLTQREELTVGVGRLRDPASPEEHHLANVRLAERCEGVIGDVGLGEVVGIGHQNAGDVERDVAVADDDRALAGQIEAEVGEVGMTVVPGDELGRRHRTRQVLAGDTEPLVRWGSDRIDDGVVAGGEFVVADVFTDLDVEEVAEIALGRGRREGRLDALGGSVVGGDSRAHQPVRRG
ncbi:Uncharacterised protein [Mycobacteroides abscessus subsp. abscessus]|nr:Uncharacterised protein [Mycobacteroides abscessus subsp. abscessus]